MVTIMPDAPLDLDPSIYDKTTLRAAMRAARRILAWTAPEAAARAAALAPLDRLPPFRVVAGYAACGNEIDPAPLIARLEAGGARLALPVAVSHDAALVFRAADEIDAFVPDLFGISAPPIGAPTLVPDLIIAPVLAFDRRGGRLGQGAGCYDRTLEALRAAGSVFVIGLAYAGQEIDRVPTDAHDQALDAILTERGYSVVGKDI